MFVYLIVIAAGGDVNITQNLLTDGNHGGM